MATSSAKRSKRLKRLGKYSIKGRLGAGGMSRVYRAVADGSTTEIALKVTPVENEINVSVNCYQREVMIGRKLDHPRVITAIDHGCRDGYIYLAMPIVDGATLSNATRLRDPSRAPSSRRSSAYNDQWVVPMLEGQWGQIASMGLQLSGALAACHRVGVIHRDIKPANIMMDRTGTVFLTDFGLAWMRRGPAGHQLITRDGTARYLPPEIFEQRRDERSDIYSLGLTLHELATGLKPWGEIDYETVIKIRPELTVAPVQDTRPDIPDVLAECIDRACRNDPDERQQDADTLEAELAAAARELPRDRDTPAPDWPGVTEHFNETVSERWEEVVQSSMQSLDTRAENLTEAVWFGDV